MRGSLRLLLTLSIFAVAQGCTHGAAGPTGALSIKAEDLLLTCTEIYDVALTTGGGTYYHDSTCTGPAYAVDGDCTTAPYKTAFSTFGCAEDFTPCQTVPGIHSGYLPGDPNHCHVLNDSSSDFVPVEYNASWTCCNDGQCSGSTPACDNTNTHSCVECTNDSYCSGSTSACDTNTNDCVECTNDSYCSGSTPACDTNTNNCVECTNDSYCQSGYQCVSNFCDCESSPTCNGSPCQHNSDCGNGTCGGGVCIGGTCHCPTRPVRG